MLGNQSSFDLIAALTPEQLPRTADGLKKVFGLARTITPLAKASK